MESEAFFENLHGFLTVKEGISKIIPSFFTVKEGTFESLRLPLAKGSSTSNQAFLLRRKDVTALLGARNRYALRLADHQRSSPWLCGMEPPGAIGAYIEELHLWVSSY